MYNKHGDTMRKTIQAINAMRTQLGWDQTDDLVSLMGYLNEEVAELNQEINKEVLDYQAIEEELADVLMVALALADDLKLDVHTIIEKKMVHVIKKYENL